MSPNFILVLLLLVIPATVEKYVYVNQNMLWSEAQTYCRTTFTDLAPISNEYDTGLLRKLNAPDNFFIWIGMIRDTTNKDKWLWSGGGQVATFFWASTEPNNYGGNEDYGAVRNYSWYDCPVNYIMPFFCYKVYAVQEKKTWEEALEYCRESHGNLASVASDTEMMLMKNELRKALFTEFVWIGLRFLAGGWRWVDGQPYAYDAWSQGGNPSCPSLREGCGALQMFGNKTNTGYVQVADVKVWNAHDCDNELHFLCY